MRYCPYCRRINPGYPAICHYCAHTWYVRLCPRGHENPPGALHCGACGSADLSETAGTRPMWAFFIKIVIILILFLGSVFLGKLFFASLNSAFPNLWLFIVCIIILIGAYFYGLSVLPNPIRRFFSAITGFIMNSLSQFIIWTGVRIKEFLKMLVRW